MSGAKINGFGGRPRGAQLIQAVDISFLFISYSRSDLLEQSIAAIRESLKQDFPHTYEIVIADDCSPEFHASRIRSIGADTLVVSPKNKGLGFNHNQGIVACRGKYIVQIQDDWKFVGSASIFSESIRYFEAYGDIGIIRLTTPGSEQCLEYQDRKFGETILQIYENDGIKELRKCSARPYSDQPHIKRRQFSRDLGPYREGIKMHWMELDFQRRVAMQDRWKIACFVEESVFMHLGAKRSFNPVYLREARIRRILSYPLIGLILSWARPTLRFIRDTLLFHRKIRD